MRIITLLSAFTFPFFIACNSQVTGEKQTGADTLGIEDSMAVEEPVFTEPEEFSRDSIVAALQKKIDSAVPLVIHIFVPLCDNEHQAIVPVGASLGDGMNLKTNLYWGAGYGIKTHFSRIAAWKNISFTKDVTPEILERAVFYREFGNGAIVYLVADAWRGDRMKKCIETYLETLAGMHHDSIILPDSTVIPSGSNADLIAFNGHNGMMENEIYCILSEDNIHRDAVVIACASHGWFAPCLRYAGGYPLVTTTSLLAPEAYVMEAVSESWALMKTNEEIRLSAGDGYHKVQQCGQKGARNMFHTGW